MWLAQKNFKFGGQDYKRESEREKAKKELVTSNIQSRLIFSPFPKLGIVEYTFNLEAETDRCL